MFALNQQLYVSLCKRNAIGYINNNIRLATDILLQQRFRTQCICATTMCAVYISYMQTLQEQ